MGRKQKFPEELQTVELPTNGISEEGRKAVIKHLRDMSPRRCLPDDWNWDWTVTGTADYVGTFPKRVGKYFHMMSKIYGYENKKLSKEQLSKIGSLAASYVASQQNYLIRFVNRFNWNDGDYGDSGSCFWGGRSDARDLLEEHDAWAVLFYEHGTTDEQARYHRGGTGRAWLTVHPLGRHEGYILFNAYSNNQMHALQQARVVAAYWDQVYKRVTITNCGDEEGLLYLNNDGMWIGDAEHVYANGDGRESFDFDYDESDYDGWGQPTCSICDCRYDPDYGYGEYCEDCGTLCQRCSIAMANEDTVTVYTHYGEESWCQYCVDRAAAECASCLEPVSNVRENICPSCGDHVEIPQDDEEEANV